MIHTILFFTSDVVFFRERIMANEEQLFIGKKLIFANVFKN